MTRLDSTDLFTGDKILKEGKINFWLWKKMEHRICINRMLENAFRALHICEEQFDQLIKIEQNASQPEFLLEPGRHTHQKVEENFV